MANKTGKFGIKFWLTADAETKYVLKECSYLEKDKQRLENVQFGEYVVKNLTGSYLEKAVIS